MTRVLGAVLAGGASRRFGSDKAQAELDGVTLLDLALAGIARFADTVIVCGRELPGRTCLADRPEAGLGPLGGLNAALWWAREQGFDGVLATGCDTPLFPDSLGALLAEGGAAVVEGHHLIGYWPIALADVLDAHLRTASDRSVRAWIRLAGARSVAIAGALPNINTGADLEALRRRAR